MYFLLKRRLVIFTHISRVETLPRANNNNIILTIIVCKNIKSVIRLYAYGERLTENMIFIIKVNILHGTYYAGEKGHEEK